jgi:hypothetical protein
MNRAIRGILVACALGALSQTAPGLAQNPPPSSDACDKDDGAATFKADPDVQKVAEAYSLDAVDMARQAFDKKLDWTDKSVSTVEDILDAMYKIRAKEKPSDEDVWTFAKMYGSYVGEAYRRNHGATWGIVTFSGDSFPGMQTKGCVLFWPWGKVGNRLDNGPEDNVWHYYQALLVPKTS